MNKLQKFLALKEESFNSIIYGSSARILALIVSDHEHYNEFIEDVKIFIGVVIANSQ